jgi:hypothetical protein
VELRTPLQRITRGADLSQIDGIGPDGAMQLIAQIGTDMSRGTTEKHFTSWLTLAPNNKISGGRLLSSTTPHSANRAAAVLRRAAMSLTRSSTSLGAYYRRLAGRLGPPQAITATARKLALLLYRGRRGDLTYHDPGASAYLELHRTRLINSLRRRAQELGLSLLNLQTGELLDHVVVPQSISEERSEAALLRRPERSEGTRSAETLQFLRGLRTQGGRRRPSTRSDAASLWFCKALHCGYP